MKAAEFVTGIQHIGLPVRDLEQTEAFYAQLGFSAALRTENEATGSKVVFLRLKDLVIEAYETPEPAGKPGAIDHIALDVTDIDAVFALVSAAGHVLLDKEVRFLPFWENGVRFFTILGPNGEKIEFCQKM